MDLQTCNCAHVETCDCAHVSLENGKNATRIDGHHPDSKWLCVLQEGMEEGGPGDAPRQDGRERAIHPRQSGLHASHGRLLSAHACLSLFWKYFSSIDAGVQDEP